MADLPEKDPPGAAPAGSGAEPNMTATRHAAEADTAMWGEDELRAAGLGDLADLRASSPSDPPPATRPSVGGADSSTIQVDSSQSFEIPQPPRPDAASGVRGLSWPVTIGLAVCLSGAVYVVVRIFI